MMQTRCTNSADLTSIFDSTSFRPFSLTFCFIVPFGISESTTCSVAGVCAPAGAQVSWEKEWKEANEGREMLGAGRGKGC
jgi:hypothetical protein